MLSIVYKPSFVRAYKKLPSDVREEVRDAIALFQEDPEHSSLRVHELTGRLQGRWSLSVNFAYRIIFLYQKGEKATLLTVGDHSIYR